MAPPIQFGLGLSLARAGGAAFDADAAAYIAAVATAGATVSGGQKKAIDTFYKTGKSDGWYSSLKRMYLPIWASAAPNAIDMIALGSGTFNGTVTHGAGFVQGDGSTGYFDFGVSPSTLAMSTDSLLAVYLNYEDEGITFKRFIDAHNSGSQTMSALQNPPTTIGIDAGNTSTARLLATSDLTGIILNSRVSGTTFIQRRITSGSSTIATATVASAGSMPTNPIYALARLQGGYAAGNKNKVGAYGVGLGLSSGNGENYSLALKNLWETATGLTLP
jgi:hypothetical protein